jgi:hypothetical protein
LIARLAALSAAIGMVVCTAGFAANDRSEPQTHNVTICLA